ncbi:RHS repeat-associated core domain-containing protein [Pseudomonas sp. NPDC089422]|uniref:RHS repeat-associated core domain-containing protein n=1 Tax=Pseudomonas sp. NPDC089422 TaxID=3364466 RepID=UPI003818C795
MAYLPYGHSCHSARSRLAFCGEHRDAMSGVYHLGNGHRTYNPILMRFHSADALSPFGVGGINAYTYCSSDPVNRVDRNGAFSIHNSIFLTVLAEGALNVTDGVLSAFKVVVQGRLWNSAPTLSQQFQVFAKVHKGTLKVAASALLWGEQGAPAIPTVKESVVAGAAATGLGLLERLVNLQQHATVVVPYLRESPARIPGVALETLGILTGVTQVQTLSRIAVRTIREKLGGPVTRL